MSEGFIPPTADDLGLCDAGQEIRSIEPGAGGLPGLNLSLRGADSICRMAEHRFRDTEEHCASAFPERVAVLLRDRVALLGAFDGSFRLASQTVKLRGVSANDRVIDRLA